MSIERASLPEKLCRYREQFQVSLPQLSQDTGIELERLTAFESNLLEPSGDEILILSDYYKCDFRFFISNKKVTSFEETDYLFRRYGDDLSTTDRWAIQEVLYLAENEEFLLESLGHHQVPFHFQKVGNNYKHHGESAAVEVRKCLQYSDSEIPINIYKDFRSLGIKVFRRRLVNSNISGLYINHPVAGKCVLVNYSEDIFRQRFTVAHEVAHSILDDEKQVVVSFHKWSEKDLIETRANTFASHYLVPRPALKLIPEVSVWDHGKVLNWCKRLNINSQVLAYSLWEEKLINKNTEQIIKAVKIPRSEKLDPELRNLSPKGEERKKALLEKGLSSSYINLCFNAYNQNIISASRMAEMLMADERELIELMSMFGVNIRYDN